MLDHLRALTFDFDAEGQSVSALLVYAQPDPDHPGHFRAVAAAETGVEGIACLDDTARAVSLALGVYESTGSREALHLAQGWLRFVTYMQDSHGDFANFILDTTGRRNLTGRTSHPGGYWWSARALVALARAYRVLGYGEYLDRFRACRLQPLPDGKINALLALAELELYAAYPDAALRRTILDRCAGMARDAGESYLRDYPNSARVDLWGYHQLHALAVAAERFERADFLAVCRRTVESLVAPDVAACCWHAYPERETDGVCAYDVAPIVQGLAALYRGTGEESYRALALEAGGWFYGRNSAGAAMYDPISGRCRDGITAGVASDNFGAESAIEAGFAELERRALEEE